MSMPDSWHAAEHDLVRARRLRLTERLDAGPFDTLVVTSPEAVDYATGYRSVAGQLQATSTLAAIVTTDRTVLVAPAADTAPALERGVMADDIVPFGRFYFAGDTAASSMSDQNPGFVEALRTALAAVRTGDIGVEGPASGEVSALVGARGNARARDATSWMLQTRAVKLHGEQELLRRAAQLAENGIEEALAAAKIGVSEQELASVVASAMVAGGGVPRFVVVTAGERSAMADAHPTARQCQPGDLLRFDVGCQLAGYWSDIARTAVVGEPDRVQQSRYDALLAGVQAEFAHTRPGVTAAEVFNATVDTVEREGFAPYRRHHVGHTIGLSVYEAPIVRPDDHTELAEGMVFSLETPYYEVGWGGMMVEDTGVVTNRGFELFTSIDRSLRVVPT